jgi:hypothetical protein
MRFEMRAWLGMLLLVAAWSGCSDAPTKPGKQGPVDLAGWIGPIEGPPPDLRPPPPDLAVSSNVACAGATPIADGTMLPGQDTTSATESYDGVCSSGDGLVLFYTATVPPGQKLVVTIAPTDGVFDPVVRIVDGCATATCLGYADSTYEGDSETLAWANPDATPRTIILAVGGYAADPGTFDLTAKIASVPANALCAGATPAVAGTPLLQQDVSGSPSQIDACLSYADGGVLYYSTTVAARTDLEIKAAPTSSPSWDPSIRLFTDCAALSCLASSDDGYAGDTETLRHRNTSMSAQPIIIAVGAGSPSQAGVFDLTLTATPIPPPPVNAACGAAIAVVDGSQLVDQDPTEGTDTLTSACESSAGGKVIYYKAALPANSRLDVVVTPTGASSWDPVVRLLSACGAATCLGSQDTGSGGSAATLTFKNPGAARNVVIAVGSYNATVTGTFDMEVSIKPLPPPASNLTCATAIAMTDGQTASNQSLESATQTLTSACLPSAAGPVLFYSASVPNQRRLIAKVTPVDSLDSVIRVLSACNTSMCLASADATAGGGNEMVTYRNTSGVTASVSLGVGNYGSAAMGVFNLTTWVKTLATNTTCAAPKAVTAGTALSFEDGGGATAAGTGFCLGSATGKVLFYSISVPAGKTLQAQVYPLSSWDPVIRIISSCAATTCLASADAAGGGSAELASYTNSGASAQPVIIAVGGYTTTGDFDLQVAIP